MSDIRTAKVRAEVETALRGLSSHFRDSCKLTFVMRKPGDPECFMIVTDDEPGEVASLLIKQEAP